MRSTINLLKPKRVVKGSAARVYGRDDYGYRIKGTWIGNRVMNLLLFWISGYLRCRIIWSEGKPYLERYFICKIGKQFFYLHRFLSDDPDEMHNHPFNGGSVIPCGWYTQQRRWGYEVRRWFNIVLAETFHRVILPNRVYVWSIFFHGERVKAPWGMLRKMRLTTAGEGTREILVFAPYEYDQEGKNPSAAGWWLEYPRGNDYSKQQREAVDYVIRK